MSKERPYEYVPTVALVILLEEYEKLIRAGDFKKQYDFSLMYQELDYRFVLLHQEDKQISIEEYLRKKK